jgi:hypothetical protein
MGNAFERSEKLVCDWSKWNNWTYCPHWSIRFHPHATEVQETTDTTNGVQLHVTSRTRTYRLRILFFFILSGVRLSPLGTAAATGLMYQPQMLDDGDCGAIGGMKIGRGNRSTRRKPAPVPLCPPQIPYDQTRARTRAAAVGSQRQTAWAMAWPLRRLK